jgi:hypothetical protein
MTIAAITIAMNEVSIDGDFIGCISNLTSLTCHNVEALASLLVLGWHASTARKLSVGRDKHLANAKTRTILGPPL